jgi:hypothetical protein
MQLSLTLNDSIYGGVLAPSSFAPPAGSIPNVAIPAAAGISASKLQHQYEKEYAQPGATAAFVERKVVHVVRGANASITDFQVGAVVAALGAATATVDLQSNGVSLLTAPVSLTSATAAYGLVAGALAAGAGTLVAGNVIEIVVSAATVGGGTLAKGLFGQANIREDAQ